MLSFPCLNRRKAPFRPDLVSLVNAFYLKPNIFIFTRRKAAFHYVRLPLLARKNWHVALGFTGGSRLPESHFLSRLRWRSSTELEMNRPILELIQKECKSPFHPFSPLFQSHGNVAVSPLYYSRCRIDSNGFHTIPFWPWTKCALIRERSFP